MTTPAELDALTAHPQLRHIRDLRTAGFVFFPIADNDGIPELRALKPWFLGWVDAFVLRGPDGAGAARRDPSGAVAWWHSGPLPEVVDALLALSAPRPWTGCQCGNP